MSAEDAARRIVNEWGIKAEKNRFTSRRQVQDLKSAIDSDRCSGLQKAALWCMRIKCYALTSRTEHDIVFYGSVYDGIWKRAVKAGLPASKKERENVL